MNGTVQTMQTEPKIKLGLSDEGKRIIFASLGIALFALFYFLPQLPPAVDPTGKAFALSREAQLSIGLFLLAGIWWVFEVIPIGVTSIAIGVIQAAFMIRPVTDAFALFMDPSVLFILGSLMLGLAFTKAGLTNRLAFKMLSVVGEDTRKILLGVFTVTLVLTLLMAHTAVAATMFPLMMAIMSMYDSEGRPSNFGRAMFIGMAYSAGAGSLITLLGASRGPVALGFFKEITGFEVSFLQYTMYMGLLGVVMMLLTWFLLSYVFCKPEQKTVAGLKHKVEEVYAELGPMTRKEILVIVLALAVVLVLASQQFVPALAAMNRSIPILIAAVIMFLTKLFTVEDLEKGIPWNIVLLFGGAMSIGTCLWVTGAAEWMAINWLTMFQHAHWLVFVVAIGLLVIVMTNFIMNVAAIAITMPVALVMSQYLGVNPYLILCVCLAAAGLPFMLLVGAAPNAIAYQSRQFTTGQFFLTGIPFTILALVMIALFALLVWPVLGIPALIH